MFRLLLATRNPHKASEIGSLLRDLPIRLATLDEFPQVAEVEEDGATLEENARKKASQCAAQSGLWALADDTGLEVAALGGAPGVYSARYAGPGATYSDNNKKLVQALRGKPAGERGAVFRCVVALADPSSETMIEEGRLEGKILASPRGKRGFGYDPLFYISGRGKTLAELSAKGKNALSHRAIALGKMRARLERLVCCTAERNKDDGSICPRCGLGLEDWHCRKLCRSCGFQMDCSDFF